MCHFVSIQFTKVLRMSLRESIHALISLIVDCHTVSKLPERFRTV